MIFYMFKGIAAKLFLSTSMVTTLIFPAPIEKVIAGWDKDDVYKYQSLDRKVLVLRAVKEVHSNMTVITTNGLYDFNISVDEKFPHKGSIEIKNGRPSTSFKEIIKTTNYQILEGEQTVLIIPTSEINVNGKKIDEQGIYPKGAPIFINGKRVLY